LPVARLFDQGWKQLRSGKAKAAAETFERALALNPSESLAEDAAFWHGAALARSGQSRRARTALGGFLDRYPRSPRRGEASAMLGWILLGDNDLDGAEARFRSAKGDPVKSVRESAAKGLRAVKATRAQ
jgi:TolA-binding protein